MHQCKDSYFGHCWPPTLLIAIPGECKIASSSLLLKLFAYYVIIAYQYNHRLRMYLILQRIQMMMEYPIGYLLYHLMQVRKTVHWCVHSQHTLCILAMHVRI